MRTRSNSGAVRTGFVTVAVAAVVLLAPACLTAAAAEPGGGTLTAAQERLDAARAEAARVVENITAARTEQSGLEAEIARSEEEIPALRARAGQLRVLVRERAARLYVRYASPRLDVVVSTDNVVDAARAAHLTETIGAHDRSVATKLQDVARDLEERQVTLRARRAELEDTIASLATLHEQLERRVNQAVAAYQQARIVPRVRTASVDARAPAVSGDAVWETFRECTFAYESGGDYEIVSPGGRYHGAWQFLPSTWNAVAGRMGRDDLVGVLPSHASPADQDAVAHALWLESGNRPWGGRC